MTDARFQDGAEVPIRLRAETPDDLPVISTLIQDAVAPTSEMSWLAKHRRFALLINRFRWEDHDAAKAQNRPFERVQSVLGVDGVLKVRSNGVDPSDKDLIVSLLALEFEAGEDGAGTLTLMLAGDGAIALDVECIDVTLTDVSRPYKAPSGKAPTHDLS